MFEYPVITKEQIKPGIFRIDNDEYHQGAGVSSSQLKDILKSPAHCQIPNEQTKAMAFGSAFHMAILEPKLFAATYKIMPSFSGTGMKARKAAWVEKNEGCDLISSVDMDLINSMGESLKKSKIWDRVKGYDVEIAHFANHPATGILQKCKADMIGDWIIDLKSTGDASGDAFFKSVNFFKYHVSAAYYQDIVKQATGRSLPFMWIAVEKTPPYAVAFYDMPAAMGAVGREEYEAAMILYKECETTGEWPGYPDEIQSLPVPGWFYK